MTQITHVQDLKNTAKPKNDWTTEEVQHLREALNTSDTSRPASQISLIFSASKSPAHTAGAQTLAEYIVKKYGTHSGHIQGV